MVNLNGVCIGKGEGEVDTVGQAAPATGARIEQTCCWLGVLVGISLIAALVAVILTRDTTLEVTVLRQVHVLITHGERTPSQKELATLGAVPPAHVFVPYGSGAMTNEGKLLTFKMGALLRKRYNDFLGPYYEPDTNVVIASDTKLSKMTALLISAGLWPPAWPQAWNDTIAWQPVPYTYPPKDEDFLIYEENCPRYNQEKQRMLKVFEEKGFLLPHKDFFNKIAQMTNTNFSSPQEASALYNLFVVQDNIKVENPKWAKNVKTQLQEIAALEYSMMFHDNLLRKLSGGALLEQIIKEAVSNTIDSSSCRVIVRTGTPTTVAALLSSCVEAPPRLPNPGVALIFELHEKLPRPRKEISHLSDEQRFGFKIYYWDGDSAEPRLLEVPGCNSFCPLETFKDITKNTVSHNYVKDCGLTPTN